MSAGTKLRRTLALALAGGTLAIGVPAALAAGGDSGSDAGSSNSTAPSPGFVQDEQQPDRQNRPDHDCPERDGEGGSSGSGESGSSGSGDADTSAPSV